LKDDILGSLVPLLKASSTNPEGSSDESRKRTVRRRRPRPRSTGNNIDESEDLDHIASNLQASGFGGGSSYAATATTTGHFGTRTAFDMNNESQATTDGCKSSAFLFFSLLLALC